MATPYYTSDDLIAAVKRKISVPIYQNTYTEDDILNFANEEMMISQVPSVMVYHEEFFTTSVDVPLEGGKIKYQIPERAIGRKLRDVFYVNTESTIQEMTQISPDDISHFTSGQSSSGIHKFYFEGDFVVLVANETSSLTGSLRFSYFLRPNLLVQNERAAISLNFNKRITVDNTTIAVGDTISIGDLTFTAITAGVPNALEFVVDDGVSILSSIDIATNLSQAINIDGTYSSENGSPISINIVTVRYDNVNIPFSTSNTSAFTIPTTTRGIEFDNIPANITEGSIIDFMQTRGGHRTLNMSIKVPVGSISGNVIVFEEGDVPTDFVPGDYIASEFECIIPQIPDDLHTGLSERTCARILSSLGDAEGLKMTNQKINEIEARQGTLIDNRAEGAPQKINNRNSLLRFAKRRMNRR